jgi:hypothetical protein
MPQFDPGGVGPVVHRVPLGSIREWISDRISLERKEPVSRTSPYAPATFA